jgi:hypothetical protein
MDQLNKRVMDRRKTSLTVHTVVLDVQPKIQTLKVLLMYVLIMHMCMAHLGQKQTNDVCNI